MIFHNNLLLCSSLLFPFLILPYSHGYDTQKRISLDQPFQSSTFNQLPHVACVSLFHRNGRFGCGTQNQGTTDPTRVIYWKNALNNNDATQEEEEEGEDPEPYVVIMTEQEFNDENIQSLLMSSSDDDDGSETVSTDNYKTERLLHGILVLNQTAFVGLDGVETSSYNDASLSYPTSPESPFGANGYNTPSDQISGNYNENQYAWNTAGDSLMYRDMYGIPTVFIPDVDISFYLWSELFLKVEKNKGGDQQESNNKKRDLSNRVVSQFNYYMGPEAVTSEQCLTWKDASDGVWSPKCLPLGGNSVWAAAGTPPPTTDYGYNKQEQQDDGNGNDDDSSSQWEQRDVILLATNMDSTAAFHDATTAANSAASNIMTLMLAAKLIGDKLSWEELDALPKQIVFAFFQGETYGYMGSRNFIRDKEYPGFQCDDNFRLGVGCTYPLRTSLNYENLGQIVGMLSVDQVGVLQTDKTFYLHADNNGGEDFENILKNFNGQAGDYVFESSNADDGAIPPSPLVSLVELSEGNVGGVVITGYDESFSNTYHSHYDSSATLSINVDAIQEAALLLARGALASAYGNGNDDDGQNGIDYALEVLPSINNDDGNNNKNYHFDQTEVKQLYECLFEDGLCTMWESYTKTERANEKERTGIDLGTHTSRLSDGMIGVYGKRKPNYYVSVYDLDNGQPVVQVHGQFFAAFNETLDETKKQNGDGNYLIKPKSIEAGIYGYLNHALGRNIYAAEENNNNNNKKCSTSSNCNQDCPNGIGSVCAGGACVCGPSSFYHIALDESIEATPLTSTRYFQISEQDEGITPMYTEPYWSGDVGVMLYREAGDDVGIVVMVLGLFMGGVALASAMFLKKRMVKEKLY